MRPLVVGMDEQSGYAAGSHTSVLSRSEMAGARNKKNATMRTKATKDQTRSAPVAKSKVVVAKQPAMRMTSDGGFELKRRELITTIRNSTNYQVNNGVTGLVYRMNPTHGSTLTWLPDVASCYDQYVFKRLELEFVPSCGTSQSGRIGVWFDKNSEDPPPSDTVMLANMGVSVDSPPWTPFRLKVPVDDTKRFTQHTGNSNDAKLVDLGQIGYSTYDGPGSDKIGSLFAEYTVVLYYPQPAGSLLQTLSIDGSLKRTVEVGPVYFTTGRTATANDTKFFTPGTFMVTVTGFAATYSGEAPIGSASINSTSVTGSATGFTGIYNITCVLPGDGFRINGTTFTGSSTQAIRANKANVATTPA